MQSQKNNKIVGLDMDGVVIDHTEIKLELARERGVDLKRGETASEVFKRTVSKEVNDEIKNLIYDDPDVAMKPNVMDGALKALSYFSDEDIPFFLISRRQAPDIGEKLLQEKDLWPKFFDSENVNFVKTDEEKEEVARELGVTHYVDDKVKTLNKIESVDNLALFDPLDVRGDDSPYERLLSWEEIVEFIK